MSNTIDNESLSFVFKKLQGYPNTDIGLDYNQEPNSRDNYYKIFLNQVYAKNTYSTSRLHNLLQDHLMLRTMKIMTYLKVNLEEHLLLMKILNYIILSNSRNILSLQIILLTQIMFIMP